MSHRLRSLTLEISSAKRLESRQSSPCERSGSASEGLISQLGAPADHEFLQLRAQRVVERRLLVALQRRAPDLARAGRGVARTLLGPAIEVLRRGQQRT